MRSSARAWRRDVLTSLAVGAAPLIPLSVLVADFYGGWADQHAAMLRWTSIRGTSCPQVARISRIALPPPRGPMSFDYAGARFSRSYGSASCAAIPDGAFTRAVYHVCQFNNPGAVTVSDGPRRVIFEPPPGQRATVTLRHGGVGCVVGGFFTD